MTPQEYIEHLEGLFDAQRYQEFLDFASAEQDRVVPPLSLKELFGVQDMAHLAATAVQIEAEARAAVEPAPTAPRP